MTYEYNNLKRYRFENVASVLAVVYVLLGRAVTECRWGGSRNVTFMRHKSLVLTVKTRLKSVYIYGSNLKIKKTGVWLFWTTLYGTYMQWAAVMIQVDVRMLPPQLCPRLPPLIVNWLHCHGQEFGNAVWPRWIREDVGRVPHSIEDDSTVNHSSIIPVFNKEYVTK